MDALLPGLAEEITAAVSRFRWISCFADAPHANQTAPPQRDPAVVYLLDSTLQRSGKRMRIIVRLLDLHAGK